MRSKLELRKALLAATEHGVSMRRIHRESGVPYASIREFKDTGALGEEYRRLLGKWFDGEPEAAKVHIRNPAEFIALQLEVLVSALRYEHLSEEAKVEMFYGRLAEFNRIKEDLRGFFGKQDHGE